MDEREYLSSDSKRRYQKRRYEELKAAGLCVKCKKPTGGKTICAECAARACEQRAAWVARMKANHRCIRCKKPLGAMETRVHCFACRLLLSERAAARKAAKKE